MPGRFDRIADLGGQHTASASLEQLLDDIYADAQLWLSSLRPLVSAPPTLPKLWFLASSANPVLGLNGRRSWGGQIKSPVFNWSSCLPASLQLSPHHFAILLSRESTSFHQISPSDPFNYVLDNRNSWYKVKRSLSVLLLLYRQSPQCDADHGIQLMPCLPCYLVLFSRDTKYVIESFSSYLEFGIVLSDDLMIYLHTTAIRIRTDLAPRWVFCYSLLKHVRYLLGRGLNIHSRVEALAKSTMSLNIPPALDNIGQDAMYSHTVRVCSNERIDFISH